MNHEDMNSLQVLNPFTGSTALSKTTTGGALSALQSREDTEVLAMVAMAKRFPRNQVEAMDRILNAFARPSLAEQAQYQYARGGTDIVGPSIRAAEAIAQEWGNIKTGWMELERGVFPTGTPYSLVRAYALDLQTTNISDLVFYVPHWRDTKKGGYALKDERDIYELCANQAQRRKRACILALVPGDVVEQAMNQAAVTLKTSADVSPEAQKKLLAAFESWGVTKEHIEARIQRRLDSITAQQMVQMKRIYASLRDDMSRPGDWFEIVEGEKAAPKAPEPPAAKPALSDEDFAKKAAGWKKAIEGGKTVADVIAAAETRNTLSDDQRMEIASWGVKPTSTEGAAA